MKQTSPAPSRWLSEGLLISAALFIGFVIWLMAKQSQLETDQFVVPIVVVGAPPNVKLTVSPRQVPVIVRYPISERGRVSAQNFEIKLEAERIFRSDPRAWAGVREPTSQPVNLTLGNVHTTGVPQTVQVTDFMGQDRVTLEAQLIAQTFPIRAQLRGELPPQYEAAGEARTEPEEIALTGPYEALEAFAKGAGAILTEPIDLSNRTQDFSVFAGIEVPPGLMPVAEEAARVQVLVGIAEKSFAKTIENVPVALPVLTSGLSAEITPATVTIKLQVKFSAVEQIDERSFSFSAKEPLDERPGERKRVELQANLREDLPAAVREKAKIESVTPASVQVRFVPLASALPEENR